LDKRLTSGYSIHSAFTWSKAMALPYGGFTGSNMDPYDRNASYAPMYNNRAFAWTLAHEWNLPYGRGLHWGASASGVKQAALGGWVFNGITTVMSGLPVFINWSDTSSLNNGGDFGQRPNLVGNPLQNIPSGRWYNPAAFANPGLYQFGNYDSGGVVGPAYSSADWALWKQFTFKSPLQEETTLQVRFESFNLFNHTNKANPDGTADNSTAGQIFNVLSPMRQFQFGVRLVW
ncbi:MAG TPA: hypothetical protein VKW70_04865, partial [Terriglobia bacterium]|nr:hypothetical protein [Terriglobia bacterium]